MATTTKTTKTKTVTKTVKVTKTKTVKVTRKTKTVKPKKPGYNKNGLILWEGLSPIDGAPIVCIITGLTKRSGNNKTADMLQTWILRTDLSPQHAYQTGDDYAICGNCPHRKWNNDFLTGELIAAQGSCYVRKYQAPRAVWECYQLGGYSVATGYTFASGRAVRFGSYGDPAMVPASVWQGLAAEATSHTGYSHQWRQPWAQALKGIVQASCDGMADYLEATAHGWKTFLVKAAGSPDPAGMAHCAASAERGAKTDCARCGLCDGASADVVIDAHGAMAGRITATV